MRSAAALFACAQALAGQAPGDAVLLLRDPSNAPVAGAAGHFRRERAAELVALRGLALPGTGLLGEDVRATSDERGMLRLPGEESFAVSGLVATPAGLGAVVARLRPREARRIALQPLGEVTTHAGSEPFTLWARAALATGERVTLPPFTGTSVRLPEASYEVWAKGRDGMTWQRLDVRSGQRSLLAFTGPAQRLRARPGTRMHPAGWPEIDVFAAGGDADLLAPALAAPFVTFRDGHCTGASLLPGPWSREPLAWPPGDGDGAAAVEIGVGAANEPATLLSLVQDAAGGWRVLATAAVRAGRCALPPPPPAATWLLLLRPGRAPAAWPWSEVLTRPRIDPPAGVPLVVRARDHQGLPAIDVAVEYAPDAMAAAAVAGHTDGRGEARLGPALAPGVLHVVDPRFANQAIALDAIPGDGVAVTVTAGSELRGVAKWPDGTAARGVVVTLRDAAGRLRPAQRAVVSGDDGSFAFAGLPERAPLVLFASASRDGRTWSGKLDRLRAGGDDCELVLRNEDPELGPGRGR